MKAIEKVTADAANHTPDLGGKATTRSVTDAVKRAINEQ
jgi:tartrate dehydrogenase/decarboxylase/D-malate dehydrogenase